MREEISFPGALQAALRESVIPWVEQKSALFMLAQPPWNAPPGIRVSPKPIPVLPNRGEGRSFLYLARWPEAGVHAMRIPYMVCVLEGEADIRIGVTQEMAARQNDPNSVSGSVVLSLPQRSILLIPPGVPHADASRPHWERPHLEQAFSHLLWMHFLPAGVSLHTCRTEGLTHTLSSSVLLSNTQIIQIVETIAEELQENHRNAAEIARTSLLTLFLYVERELHQRHRLPSDTETTLSTARETISHSAADHTATVQRARRYIQIHLNDPLTLDRIAGHAYISSRHLNRLFRSELETTVMGYVQERRLELAQSLLKNTDLPVSEISKRVGYPHTEHFNRVFRQQLGLTPSMFRRQ